MSRRTRAAETACIMRRARPARASIGAARMLDDILPYYESELTALRKLSREFAGRYPKIASRLLLEGDTCEDPHVERMIESFAFLTGRLHTKLDDECPQIKRGRAPGRERE